MLFNIYLATPVETLNPTIIVEFAAKPKSDSYADRCPDFGEDGLADEASGAKTPSLRRRCGTAEAVP
jgi:hypothetical protein